MKTTLQLLAMFFLSSFAANAKNYAYDLTASGSNYLVTANAPLTGNSSFTIECWFNNKGNAYTDYSRIIGFDGYACDIGLVGGKLTIYDGSWRSTTSNTISTGWHHVAVTGNTSNIYVYVDGVQVLTKTSVTYNFSSRKMYVGISKDLNSNSHIQALYDEIRVWNIARTLSQIDADRVKQLTGVETGLVAYYQMSDLTDKSNSGNTLSKVGTASPVYAKFRDYLNDYSLKFDGSDDRTEFSNGTSTTTFTIEVQFKTSQVDGNYRRIIGGLSYDFELGLTNGIITSYRSNWSNTIANNLADGNWHHAAVVKSGTSLQVYIDGALVQTRTVSNFALSSKVYFGNKDGSAVGEGHLGELDEMKIWKVAKTQAEIFASMDSTLDGSETDLLCYFDCNTPSTTAKNLKSGSTDLVFSGAAYTQNLPQYFATSFKIFEPGIKSYTENKRCGNGTVTLQAQATSGNVNWYDAASGGTLKATGNSFTTPSISTSTTYYIEAALNGNKTSYRIPVIATVNAAPTVNITAAKNPICIGESTILTASGANTYTWLTDPKLAPNGATATVNPNSITSFSVIGTENVNNCKDTASIEINVFALPSDQITQTGNTLSSDAIDCIYQWIDCANNTAISGATGRTFTPTVSGSYKVSVNNTACSVTSQCVSVNLLGVKNWSADNIHLYPIPAKELLNLDIPEGVNAQYTIADMNGKIMLQGNLNNAHSQINLGQISAGLYTIQLTSENKNIFVQKIIK